tara:strand:- start:104 stop:814 length:711 start_codon:yes stop_codon:yes gene_type:complete
MPTSRISGNQIEETTNATLKGLDFAVDTAILKLPTGTENERPASGAVGMLRFNTTEDKVEQFLVNGPDNLPGWKKVKGGGSASGLGEFSIIKGNGRTIEEDIIIPAVNLDPPFLFEQAFTVGPTCTIASGYTLTVGEGVRYTIVGDNPDTWTAMDAGGFASKVGPGWTIIGSDDGLGEFNLIRGNSKTIDENLTIPFSTADQEGYAFEQSCTVGPSITISSGFTVTVTEGVTYEIL